MNKRTYLTVLLQAFSGGLHPISRRVLTTAVRLGREGGYRVQGVLFCTGLQPGVQKELQHSGLDEAVIFRGKTWASFYPERQAEELALLTGETSDAVLFPATPEGRAVSSELAAMLKTGVTADCTGLSFTEKGDLLQTRPAFSGGMMADILTDRTRPQIASLRFGSPSEPADRETELIFRDSAEKNPPYPAEWTERVESQEAAGGNVIVAVGGGLQDKEELELFRTLAHRLGGELCCSRMLVDRGWLPRRCQIGLSGKSVSPGLLITFGISGSVQFRAGLENVGRLCAVNRDENAPIMKLADLPLTGDLCQVARAMLDQLN